MPVSMCSIAICKAQDTGQHLELGLGIGVGVAASLHAKCRVIGWSQVRIEEGQNIVTIGGKGGT